MLIDPFSNDLGREQLLAGGKGDNRLMWPIIVCKVYKNYQVEYRDELIIEKDDSLVKGRTQKESQKADYRVTQPQSIVTQVRK